MGEKQYKTPRFSIEPFAVYKSNGQEHVTSHQLADYRHCPWHYRRRMSGLVGEAEDEWQLIGAATHCLSLEGEAAFDRDWIVGGPINEKTQKHYGEETQAFAKWRAEQTKSVLSEAQYALVFELAFAVRRHPLAKQLLSRGQAEGVLRGSLVGVPCQVRLDFWNPDCGISDLKTCFDLDEFAELCQHVAEDRWRKRKNLVGEYVHQMALYRDLVAEETLELADVHLIAVEKQEPYRVGVWRIAGGLLSAASFENIETLRALAVSRALDCWPTHYEEMRMID